MSTDIYVAPCFEGRATERGLLALPETSKRALVSHDAAFGQPRLETPQLSAEALLLAFAEVFPGFPEVFLKEGSLERMGKVPLDSSVFGV